MYEFSEIIQLFLHVYELDDLFDHRFQRFQTEVRDAFILEEAFLFVAIEGQPVHFTFFLVLLFIGDVHRLRNVYFVFLDDSLKSLAYLLAAFHLLLVYLQIILVQVC